MRILYFSRSKSLAFLRLFLISTLLSFSTVNANYSTNSCLSLLQDLFYQNQRYTLFRGNGSFVAKYTQTIRGLRGGDILDFSDGHSFEYIRTVSDRYPGGTTEILEVVSLAHSGRHFALRVPKFKDDIPDPYSITEYIDHFIEGHSLLRQAELPIPKIIGFKIGRAHV